MIGVARLIGIDPGLRFTGWGVIDVASATGGIRSSSPTRMCLRMGAKRYLFQAECAASSSPSDPPRATV